MKETVSANVTTIDNQMFNLFKLTFKYADRHPADMVKSAIHWYINTGRAPLTFIQRFVNLSNRQLTALLNRCMRVWSCEDDTVSVATKYISGIK